MKPSLAGFAVRHALIRLAACLAGLGLPLAHAADLAVSKTADVDSVAVGEQIVYTLTATNNGPENVAVFELVDQLPMGVVSLDSASPGCAGPDLDHRVTCSGGLDAGADQQFTLTVTVDGEPGVNQPLFYLSSFDANLNQPVVYARSGTTGCTEVFSANASLDNPAGVNRDSGGALLVADRGPTLGNANDGAVIRIAGDTGVQALLSQNGWLQDPADVLEGGDGQLYVSDGGGRIVRVDPGTGAQTPLSEGELLTGPRGLLWHEGLLYVADASGSIIQVNPETGEQTSFAAGGPMLEPMVLAFDAYRFLIADGAAGLLELPLEGGVPSLLLAAGETFLPSDLALENQIAYLPVGANSTLVVVDLSAGPAIVDEFIIARAVGLPSIALGDDSPGVCNTATIRAAGNDDPDPANDSGEANTPFGAGAVEPVEIVVTETVSVSDAPGVVGPVEISVTETVAVSDPSDVVGPVDISVTETVAVADAPQVGKSAVIQISETVTVSDSYDAQSLLRAFIQIDETITATDSASVTPAVSRPMTESISVTATVALTAFGDTDGDGLANLVDGTFDGPFYADRSREYSNTFTDRHLGGASFGELEARGGLSYQVRDVEGNGFQLWARGESDMQGVITACDFPGQLLVSHGDVFELSCGSLVLRVLSGEVVVVVDQDTSVRLPAGAQTTLDFGDAGQVLVSNDGASTAVVTVDDRGTQRLLQPGEQTTIAALLLEEIPVLGSVGLSVLAVLLVLLAGLRGRTGRP